MTVGRVWMRLPAVLAVAGAVVALGKAAELADRVKKHKLDRLSKKSGKSTERNDK